MKRLINRLIQLVITLIGVSFLTFCLTYLSPGDPAAMVLEASDTIVSQEIIEQTREEMGLNDPFFGLHLTIGKANEQNLEHSKYITRQCIKFDL